jgi:hypothetical protein
MLLHALECPNCGRRFGVTVGTGKISVESLPDPFEAICIHCETVSHFAKASVATIEIEPSRER